jgi:glutaredoxin
MAKAFLSDKGIEYVEYNVASDLAKRKEMIDKTGQMGVPVIEVGNDTIVGFDEPKLRELLGIK